MKTNRIKMIVIFLFISNLNLQSQVSNLTNTSLIKSEFLGWDGFGIVKSLDIRNDFNQSINFSTNKTQRMTISSSGFVGVGNNFNTPLSVLHVNGNKNNSGEVFRTNGPSNITNVWRLETGSLEKFKLFVPADSFNVHLNVSNSSGNMQLQTGGVTRIFIQQSENIAAFGINTSGFIGIGGITNPTSPLHIKGRETANSSGWQRGLTISGGNIYLTRADYNTPDTAFFMAYPSSTPNGNFFCGTVSSLDASAVRDYAYTIGTQTKIGGANSVNPLNSIQFYKNVLISDGGNQRRLGINTLNPQNTLEINTSANSAVPGNSGLRLTDLTSASYKVYNPGRGVLSVDQSGNVIYVEEENSYLEKINELNEKSNEKDSIINDLTEKMNDINIHLTQLESLIFNLSLHQCTCEMNGSNYKENNGNGNNIDGIDESNPGKGGGGPNGEVNGTYDDEGSKNKKESKSVSQIILSSKDAIVLSQNVPNPFAESTMIEYNIPENVKKTQIHFSKNDGSLINSLEITERGTGELKVYAADLSSGIYQYTLVADGKVVMTKQMMKE